MGKTHRLTPTRFWFTYGPSEPALVVRSGDSVVTTTRDAGGGDERRRPIPPEMKQQSPGTSLFEANPLTGPIVVEGAKPGDALAVHLRRIVLTRDTAYSRHLPGFMPFGSSAPGADFQLGTAPPATDFLWKLDRKRMTGTLKLTKSRARSVTIPLHPFIGCIGTAPRYGRVETSCTPGEYGGNMDCIETKPGTMLYLPVFVEGAYLYFGDIHAAQGDGEICCVALETSAEVTLEVRLVKRWNIEWPRLEDRTHIMTACSAKPLMDAFALAHCEMIRWLENDFGFDRWEAYQLVSQVGTSRIGNVVDPRFTVVAKFPKKYLPRPRRR
jgi:acetamidase/formamidase